MKKSKFTEVQIAFILRQAEEGTPVPEVCQKASAMRHSTIGALHSSGRWSINWARPGGTVRDFVSEAIASPMEAALWSSRRTPWISCFQGPVALYRLAVLGRATGQRISDLVGMRPVDRDQDGIAMTITKLGDRPHWCPLRPEDIAIIDGWKQFKAATYFARVNGRRHTDNSMRAVWNAFATTEAGAALRGFTPHDLRATKVCDERIHGRPHQQIAAMVGPSRW